MADFFKTSQIFASDQPLYSSGITQIIVIFEMVGLSFDVQQIL